MTVLEATALTLRCGQRRIVDDVSLRLTGGSLVAVIGPNGAGKSTLLRLLAGLTRADTGRVTLDGTALDRIDRRLLARRRGFLAQGSRAEWPIAVERLVALGLTPHLPAFGGLPPALAGRVAAALEEFDLLDRRDQPATTLSGGELARAMLARALVGEPEVLIVDEPLAGLDPRHAIDSIVRLRALADTGRLVIASFHDLALTARHATELAVMHRGRLVASGATAERMTSALLGRVFEVEAEVTAAGTPDATVTLLSDR